MVKTVNGDEIDDDQSRFQQSPAERADNNVVGQPKNSSQQKCQTHANAAQAKNRISSHAGSEYGEYVGPALPHNNAQSNAQQNKQIGELTGFGANRQTCAGDR